MWKTVLFASKRSLGMATVTRVRLLEHPFDSRFGVRTSDVIFPENENSERHGYHGVNPSIFRTGFLEWQKTIPTSLRGIQDYRFVDLGCGMGRALLLASEYPFRQVVGVELDPKLVDIARTNVERWMISGRAKAPIAVHQQDVLEYAFPVPPLLIFLYNPFGARIFSQMLERLRTLKADFPAPIDILYVHPECGYLLDDDSKYQLLWSERIAFDEDDKSTDAFYASSEICSVYRLRNF